MAGDQEDTVDRSDTGETVETIVEDIEVSLKARSKILDGDRLGSRQGEWCRSFSVY